MQVTRTYLVMISYNLLEKANPMLPRNRFLISFIYRNIFYFLDHTDIWNKCLLIGEMYLGILVASKLNWDICKPYFVDTMYNTYLGKWLK